MNLANFIISLSFGIGFVSCITLLLFKKVSFNSFLASLFLITSPIPLLAYSRAWLIKYYFLTVILFAAFALIKRHKKYKQILSSSNSIFNQFKVSTGKNRLYIIGFSLLLSSLFCYKSIPVIWRFDSHDLNYFSWLNEIFRIDYPGPIRAPTAYPNLLSANHLTAGSILSPFLILIKPVNLYVSYNVKFLLIFSALFNFFYSFFNCIRIYTTKIQLFLGSIILFITGLLYMSEIDYAAAISNYTILILFLTIGSECFGSYAKKSTELSLASRITILILCTSLIIAKASTFPAFLLCFILLLLSSEYSQSILKKIPKVWFLIASGIIIIVLFSWLLPKSNHGSLDLSFPLCLITPKENYYQCIASNAINPFYGWLLNDHKVNFLYKLNFFTNDYSHIYTYIYIWLYCLIPCIGLGLILSKLSNNTIGKAYGDFCYYYGSATAISILLIRESIKFYGYNMAHAYLVAPILSFTAVGILLVELMPRVNIRLEFLYILLSINIILLALNHSNYSNLGIRENFMNQEKDGYYVSSLVSLKFNELKYFDQDFCTKNIKAKKLFERFLNKDGCGVEDLSEIKSALIGERSNVSLRAKHSLVREFTIIEE